MKEIKQVTHYKIFVDKLYAIFHPYNITEQLEQEILKIGSVLGPRWAACSLRAAQAVRQIIRYFMNFSAVMAARMSNKYFLYDLALMLDILQKNSAF